MEQETSSTSPQLERLVRRVFRELQGNYGSRFLNQWRTGQTTDRGHDAGVVNAMRTWAKRLAHFGEASEGEAAVESVLLSLPADPPSLPEFHGLCNQALMRMRDGQQRLEHKRTPEEQDRADKAAAMAKDAMRKASDHDPLEWAKRPRSLQAVQAVIDTAKNDRRFRAIVGALTEAGAIAADGTPMAIWDGGRREWARL